MLNGRIVKTKSRAMYFLVDFLIDFLDLVVVIILLARFPPFEFPNEESELAFVGIGFLLFVVVFLSLGHLSNLKNLT